MPARDLIRGQTRRSSSYAYARESEEKSYAKLGQLAKEKGDLTNKATIFDEAVSNLDQQTAEHFAKTINKLKGKVTMLFITHQIPSGY